MNKTQQIACGFVFILVVAASLCAETQIDSDLRSRVIAYWSAVEERDWSTTYKLEKQAQAPSQLDPFEYYHKKSAEPRYRSIKLETLDQDGDNGTVVILATHVLPLGPKAYDIPRYLRSEWERVDGAWYHVESRMFHPEQFKKKEGATDTQARADKPNDADSRVPSYESVPQGEGQDTRPAD